MNCQMLHMERFLLFLCLKKTLSFHHIVVSKTEVALCHMGSHPTLRNEGRYIKKNSKQHINLLQEILEEKKNQKKRKWKEMGRGDFELKKKLRFAFHY